jgi:hypothetical protein
LLVAYVTYGIESGACRHVHATLERAAACLGKHLRARRNSDRRIWRLDQHGRREELTAAETDQSYEIWSRECF